MRLMEAILGAIFAQILHQLSCIILKDGVPPLWKPSIQASTDVGVMGHKLTWTSRWVNWARRQKAWGQAESHSHTIQHIPTWNKAKLLKLGGKMRPSNDNIRWAMSAMTHLMSDWPWNENSQSDQHCREIIIFLQLRRMSRINLGGNRSPSKSESVSKMIIQLHRTRIQRQQSTFNLG